MLEVKYLDPDLTAFPWSKPEEVMISVKSPQVAHRSRCLRSVRLPITAKLSPQLYTAKIANYELQITKHTLRRVLGSGSWEENYEL